MNGPGRHLDEARLHDLVDGELDRLEERAARAHLERCDGCALRVSRIEALLDAARSLPAEATPSRDLWPGIESRIRDDGSVIAFPGPGDAEPRHPSGAAARPAASSGPVTSRRRSGRATADPVPPSGPASRDPRRVTVAVPVLWAAGIAVSLVSGGAVWLALSQASPTVAAVGGAGAPASEVARVGAPDVLSPVRTRRAAVAYEEATAELEAVLEAGRDLLDEQTLRTVEESLATVDRAIAEAEAALARDPASELLHRLILQHQRSRLRILRQATNGIQVRT